MPCEETLFSDSQMVKLVESPYCIELVSDAINDASFWNEIDARTPHFMKEEDAFS